MSQSLITIITDYGTKDHDAGILRGGIQVSLPTFKLIEITHNITKFNHLEAAFVLKNCINRFPAGTIHLVDIADFKNVIKAYLLVKFLNQWLLVPDNGLVCMIVSEEFLLSPEPDIWQIPFDSGLNMNYILDSVLPIVGALRWDNPQLLLGSKTNQFKRLAVNLPSIVDNAMRASIIYIDSFGNLYSNVTDKDFFQFCNRKKFEIHIRQVKINQMVQFPSFLNAGDFFATFSDLGLLMVGCNGGVASDLLGVKLMDSIMISVNDN